MNSHRKKKNLGGDASFMTCGGIYQTEKGGCLGVILQSHEVLASRDGRSAKHTSSREPTSQGRVDKDDSFNGWDVASEEKAA